MLKKVISAEWYKIRTSFFLVILLFLYFFYGLFQYTRLDDATFGIVGENAVYLFPAFGSIFFGFMNAIIFGYIGGDEYRSGRISNIISSGISRQGYIAAKMIVSLCLATVVSLLSFLLFDALIFYRLHLSPLDFLKNNGVSYPMFLLTFVLQQSVMAALFLTIGCLVRKQLVGIVTSLILVYFDAILNQVAVDGFISVLRSFAGYTPVTVLKEIGEKFAMDPGIYSEYIVHDMVSCGLLIVIIVVGMMIFCWRRNV